MIRHYEVIDDVTLILIDGNYEITDDVADGSKEPRVELKSGDILKSLEKTKLGKFLIENELVMEQL